MMLFLSLLTLLICYDYLQVNSIAKTTTHYMTTYYTHQQSHLILNVLKIESNLDILMFVKLVFTPMLRVMVCPSLKPKSSFGPESPSWAHLLISFSCFTHLQGGRDTHRHRYGIKQCISAVFRKTTACSFP